MTALDDVILINFDSPRNLSAADVRSAAVGGAL